MDDLELGVLRLLTVHLNGKTAKDGYVYYDDYGYEVRHGIYKEYSDDGLLCVYGEYTHGQETGLYYFRDPDTQAFKIKRLSDKNGVFISIELDFNRYYYNL